MQLIREGRIYGFFVIPEKFEKDAISGRGPTLEYYTNLTYFIPGTLAFKGFKTVAVTTAGGVVRQTLVSMGLSDSSLRHGTAHSYRPVPYRQSVDELRHISLPVVLYVYACADDNAHDSDADYNRNQRLHFATMDVDLQGQYICSSDHQAAAGNCDIFQRRPVHIVATFRILAFSVPRLFVGYDCDHFIPRNRLPVIRTLCLLCCAESPNGLYHLRTIRSAVVLVHRIFVPGTEHVWLDWRIQLARTYPLLAAYILHSRAQRRTGILCKTVYGRAVAIPDCAGIAAATLTESMSKSYLRTLI